MPGHPDLQLLILYRAVESIDGASRLSIDKLADDCCLSTEETVDLLAGMSEADLIDLFKSGDLQCPVKLYSKSEDRKEEFFQGAEFRVRISFKGKLFLKVSRARIGWEAGRKSVAQTTTVSRELVAMPVPPGPMVHIKPESVVNGPTFATDEYIGLMYAGRNYKCHVEEFAEAVGGIAR